VGAMEAAGVPDRPPGWDGAAAQAGAGTHPEGSFERSREGRRAEGAADPAIRETIEDRP
jgi:hypothetical protein